MKTIRPLLTLLLAGLVALSADAAIPLLKGKLAVAALEGNNEPTVEPVPDMEEVEGDAPEEPPTIGELFTELQQKITDPMLPMPPPLMEGEEEVVPVSLTGSIAEIIHFSKGKIPGTIDTFSQPIPSHPDLLTQLRGHEVLNRVKGLPAELFEEFKQQLPGHEDVLNKLRFPQKEEILRLPREILDKLEAELPGLPTHDELLNNFMLQKEQIQNLPKEVLGKIKMHQFPTLPAHKNFNGLPTKDDVLGAFQAVKDKFPTHEEVVNKFPIHEEFVNKFPTHQDVVDKFPNPQDLIAEVEAKTGGFGQSIKDFTTGSVGLNSKLVAPLFDLGSKVIAPIVGLKAKLAAPFVFLGTALAKPLLKGGTKVAAPLVKLGQITSKGFIDRNDPFFQDLKQAFKPLSKATLPFHDATAPIREAVNLGLKGFNHGTTIDLQTEVDKIQGLEEDVQLIENAGKRFVQQTQLLGAAVLAKLFPSHSPDTITAMIEEVVASVPEVIDDPEDTPLTVEDLIGNVLAGKEFPLTMQDIVDMTQEDNDDTVDEEEGTEVEEEDDDEEDDEEVEDNGRRKRHAMGHDDGMRLNNNRMRRYAGGPRRRRKLPEATLRRKRSLAKLGLLASQSLLTKRLLAGALTYKFLSVLSPNNPRVIPFIVERMIFDESLYAFEAVTVEQQEARRSKLTRHLETVLALEKNLLVKGFGAANALRSAVSVVYEDYKAMDDEETTTTVPPMMDDETTTLPPMMDETTVPPMMDETTTTMDDETTTFPPMMEDVTTTMPETTTPMIPDTTTTLMPDTTTTVMPDTTATMIPDTETTTTEMPGTDDSIAFPDDQTTGGSRRRRRRSHVEGEDDEMPPGEIDPEMEMQGGFAKSLLLDKIKNKFNKQTPVLPRPPPNTCMASLVAMETSECHRSETYQTRTCSAAPNCANEIEEIDRMQALCEESSPGRHCRKSCFHFEDARGGSCFECRTTFIRILNRAPKCRDFNYCVLKGAICDKH